MKRLLILAILFISVTTIAQIGSKAPWMESLNSPTRATPPTFEEIVNAFETYWVDKDETVKGSGYKPFKRWESLYQHYLNADGTVMSQVQIWEVWREMNSSRNAETDESNWLSVGPLAHTNTGSWSSGQGRVNAFAIDPNDATVWYAGAPAGGIWKSEDSGTTWSPLSDELPQIGVSGIAIDPTDSNVIYITTGDDDAGDSFSVGVLKSEDGGNTWAFTGLNEGNSPSRMNEIYIDPADNNVLWLATNQGIFKTIDSGLNWINVRSGDFDDLKIKPTNSSVVYAVTASEFQKTEDGGATWSIISNGTPTNGARLVIDVTPANPEVVYIFSTDDSFGAGNIYKSSDSGQSFTETFDGSQDIFQASQAWYDMAFAVSDTNEDEIYTGVLNLWKSTDSGANFTNLNQWNQPASPAYTHADIHNLRFINGTLFCGSDGGIYTSTDGGNTFTDHTEGLAIGQFYRISISKESSEVIAGGLQDNGGYARNNDQWQNYYGADGMETAIDPNDPTRVFGFIQFGGGPYLSNSGGATLDGSFNSPEQGNWITPLQFAKDGRLYAGYSRVYELDFCSNTWVQKSSSFGPQIDRLVTDPTDENIMYVAVNNQLHRSDDKGTTFELLDSFSGNISSIEVQRGNNDIIYIVTSGSGGNVFRGDLSSGSLVLTNITGSLPAIPKLVLKHQGRHSDNPLYLGTALGVWRYDDVSGDWEAFDNNLPNSPIRDLEINLEDGKISAATYGRGVWQSALTTQPITVDVSLESLTTSTGQSLSCGDIATVITIKNNGTSAVSSFDVFYEAGGLNDTINWTGTLGSGETVDVNLDPLSLTYGSYTLFANVVGSGDQITENNDRSISLNINETGTGDTTNEFETSDDELLILKGTSGDVQCAESASLWQRGVPDGIVLNQAASGTSVYGTNLTGNYPDNTKEYLTTKCYDISAISNPQLSFQMAFELELDWDILYVEYSTDDAATWNVLGNATDENWYNSDTVPGGNCFNCPGAQWTGTEATLTEYHYDLAAFASETSMIFRFVFHSDQNTNEEGVVIDDLRIGNSTLAIDDFSISSFEVYPNPSKDIFNLNWSSTTTLDVVIYDITGKVVYNPISIPTGETSYALDMSAYASGLYVLKAQLGGHQIIKKLIVQ